MVDFQACIGPTSNGDVQASTTTASAAIRLKMAMAIFAKSEEQDTDCSTIKHIPNQVVAPDIKRAEDVPAEPFSFMKLPAEIRVMIFKQLLVVPSDIIVGYSHQRKSFYAVDIMNEHGYDKYHSPAATCQLFRVSKAFYQEAMPVYFGCNTFDFPVLDHLAVLDTLKPDYRRSIRSISFNFSGIAPAKSVKLLYGCTSLRRLSLRVGYGTTRYRQGKRLPLLKACGANDLLKVRGIEELEIRRCRYYLGTFNEEQDEWESFVGALQVLRQPRDAASLRRQDAKDFPPEKAKRTVFGKSNVMTRSERRATDGGREGPAGSVEQH
ncbi:MAG: hypothetical protein L6R39_005708 [Caloplaca ligustica]|nr:MAG: hypothetical protein L6R39_005708 [Caloplaca ligustica]